MVKCVYFQHIFILYGFLFMRPKEYFGGILKLHRPSVCPSVCASKFHVRAITLYCINGFPYNFAEVFGRTYLKGQVHTGVLNVKTQPFVPGLILLCMEFKNNLAHVCHIKTKTVTRDRTTPLSQRSRSHLHFSVCMLAFVAGL